MDEVPQSAFISYSLHERAKALALRYRYPHGKPVLKSYGNRSRKAAMKGSGWSGGR